MQCRIPSCWWDIYFPDNIWSYLFRVIKTKDTDTVIDTHIYTFIYIECNMNEHWLRISGYVIDCGDSNHMVLKRNLFYSTKRKSITLQVDTNWEFGRKIWYVLFYQIGNVEKTFWWVPCFWISCELDEHLALRQSLRLHDI